MGLLLFSARQLMLRGKINNLNFKNMSLSQEQQTIARQIADVQSAKNNAKNMINSQASQFMLQSVLTGLSGNDTVKQILGNKGLATCSRNDLQTLLNGGKINAGGKEISFTQEDFSAMNATYQQLQAQAQMQAQASVAALTQSLEASDSVQLAKLNAKDSQITLELENNQIQLQALKGEYDNVKQAASAEAKNSAPTYIA